MYQGITLEQLAQDLKTVSANKKDFVAPVGQINFTPDNTIKLGPTKEFELNDWANRQVAQWAGIPYAYYRRLAEENSELKARCANHAVAQSQVLNKQERRLVRTVGDTTRGFLSNRYRMLDNDALVENVFSYLHEAGLEINSCNLDDRHMTLKLTSPRFEGEVKKGQVIRYGIALRNSDVGSSTLTIDPFVQVLSCTNGCYFTDMLDAVSMRRVHLGGQIAAKELSEIISPASREQADQAFWSETRDVVAAICGNDVFGSVLGKMRDSVDVQITGKNLETVVEKTAKTVGLNISEEGRGSILTHLAQGGDMSQWGISNAFTRYSQDVDGYENATDLEKAGGKIINLTSNQWRAIND